MKADRMPQVQGEPAQYKASITREQFMIYEMRTTVRILTEGLSDQDAIQRIITENLLQYGDNMEHVKEGQVAKL